MKITLLLSPKDPEKRNKYVGHIDELFRDALASEVETGKVQVNDKKIEISVLNEKRVTISYSETKLKKMYIINLISPDIMKSSHYALKTIVGNMKKTPSVAKCFSIIVAYDETSQQLCTKLYPPLSSFERKLRCLVYEILVKFYGGEWYKKTISDLINTCDQIKKINEDIRRCAGQSGVNYIETALEQMTYENLIKYLFDRNPPKPYSEIIETDLSDDKIQTMTKDELVSAIQRSRAKSLWEKLFYEYTELDELEAEIRTIQNLRNQVMHAKTISYEDYLKLSQLLKKWNVLLDNCINRVETEKYSEIQMVSIAESLSSICNKIRDFTRPLYKYFQSEQFKMLSERLVQISSSFQNMVKLDSTIDFSNMIKGLLNLDGLSLSSNDDVDMKSLIIDEESSSNDDILSNQNGNESDNSKDTKDTKSEEDDKRDDSSDNSQ